MLLARIYEVFPLLCPRCGGAMRIIAFITDGPTARDILAHCGEPTRATPHRTGPRAGVTYLVDIQPEKAEGAPTPQLKWRL